MVRKLKNAVGTCRYCKSSAVLVKKKGKDGVYYWGVTCSNKDCGVRTPLYLTKENALLEWNNNMDSSTSKSEHTA